MSKWQCPYCGVKLDTFDIFAIHLSFVHHIQTMYDIDMKQFWRHCELKAESG